MRPGYLAIAVAGLLMLGCAPSPHAKPNAATSNDPKQRASFHLGVLEGWQQLPQIWLTECNKTDSSGSQVRIQAYEQWSAKNADELERARAVVNRTAERLYVKVKEQGLDPTKYIQARINFDISSDVHFTKDSKKKETCASYASQFFLDSSGQSADAERAASFRADAFSYLNKWLSRGE